MSSRQVSLATIVQMCSPARHPFRSRNLRCSVPTTYTCTSNQRRGIAGCKEWQRRYTLEAVSQIPFSPYLQQHPSGLAVSFHSTGYIARGDCSTLLRYLEKCQFSNVTVFRFTSGAGRWHTKWFPRGGNRVVRATPRSVSRMDELDGLGANCRTRQTESLLLRFEDERSRPFTVRSNYNPIFSEADG